MEMMLTFVTFPSASRLDLKRALGDMSCSELDKLINDQQRQLTGIKRVPGSNIVEMDVRNVIRTRYRGTMTPLAHHMPHGNTVTPITH